MTATIPPNHIVCPRCIDYPRLSKATSIFAGFACSACHGEGHILNPLISEWRTSTSPARLIELLGDKADEKRLDMFGRECDLILSSRVEFTVRPSDSGRWYWTTMAAWENKDCTVKPLEVCAIIRCLWPNPFIERERVECPLCLPFGGGVDMSMFVDERDRNPAICWICKDERTTEAPIIDPRWLSSTVLDLAKVIWGESKWARIANITPRSELMPVLADALLDAGCDNEEVIEHCQSGGPHVDGCWVVDSILSRV